MATIKTIYTKELRTEAEHVRSGNKLVTDAPVDNNGKGETFSPTDLLATALASCMLTIIGINAEAHGYSIDGTTVETTKIMVSNPRRVGEVVMEINLPKNNYTDKEKRLIEASAKTCPVSKSLHPDLIQTFIFNY